MGTVLQTALLMMGDGHPRGRVQEKLVKELGALDPVEDQVVIGVETLPVRSAESLFRHGKMVAVVIIGYWEPMWIRLAVGEA
jgi:hypothetical protein